MSKIIDSDSKADANNESDNPDKAADSPDQDSASYNISRSKELIKTLEQTAQQSATVLNKARSFHELHKMLSVSKSMSARSNAMVKRRGEQRTRGTKKTDET